VVTACGLAQGMDFPATVAPFILRGITLAGIDSVYASQALREEAWGCLARETDRELLKQIADSVTLEDSIDWARKLMSGEVKGRIVVDLAA
jgi:acrylyl-CoA reductase (NADPH)